MMEEAKAVEMVSKGMLSLETDVSGSGEYYSVIVEVGLKIAVIEIDLKHNLWFVYISDGMGGITDEHEIQIADAGRFQKLKSFLTDAVLAG